MDRTRDNGIICALRGVSVVYNGTKAVCDVDLDIQREKLTCFVGANGAGKSSLLKAIVGLIPYQGEILLDAAPSERAYVSQLNTAAHQFPATVYEVVHSGRQRRGRLFCKRNDHEIVEETLDMLDIAKVRNRSISALSGGQAQRVRLARALCARPKLLVLDEPAGGLDERISCELYDTLTRLVTEQHVTVLMASHDLRYIHGVADTVVEIDGGDIVFAGPSDAWCAQRGPCQ